MRQLAISGVRAHRGVYAGTAVVLAVAAALVAVTGVLVESGLRTQLAGDPLAGGQLIALGSSFGGTALMVVVMVVAATVSLALRGRRREFALLRAVGTTPRQVRRTVTLEVLVVTLAAAPPGAVAGLLGARLLDPLLVGAGMVETGFRSPLSPWPPLLAVALVLALAIPVGRLAARESARTSPTAALRTSAVESRSLGRGRQVSAGVLAGVGLLSAFSPLVVPGTLGSASAAVSAFFLVGAGALAGPAVTGWVFDRLARVDAGPTTTLAMRNLRGFSRRLTTVVVPLGLVVAAATAQTSVDKAMVAGAAAQLGAALDADLVATPAPSGGADPAQQVATVPGVASVAPVSTVPALVRTDDDETFAALAWEQTTVGVMPADPAAAGGHAPLVDPGVTAGSLTGLAEPDTVAISSDAALETGAHVGGTVVIRIGGDEVAARVVAQYSRGLALGDFLTGPPTPAAHGVDVATDAVLVALDPGVRPQTVAAALADLGLTTQSTATYVATVARAGGAQDQLSTALLLLLLAVVAVGAASTLALATASRRDELTLLQRTGTTRRQLTIMTTIESVVTAATAWSLGTVAVVPAVIGVSAGLLGATWPVVDLATYGAVSAGVLVLAVVATAVSSRRVTRPAVSPSAVLAR